MNLFLLCFFYCRAVKNAVRLFLPQSSFFCSFFAPFFFAMLRTTRTLSSAFFLLCFFYCRAVKNAVRFFFTAKLFFFAFFAPIHVVEEFFLHRSTWTLSWWCGPLIFLRFFAHFLQSKKSKADCSFFCIFLLIFCFFCSFFAEQKKQSGLLIFLQSKKKRSKKCKKKRSKKCKKKGAKKAKK